MPARRFLLVGLALLLSLRLSATTVVAPDLDSLVNQSDYIVRAVVKSATPEWREHAGRRYISTRVELEIREVVKGAPPTTLVLDILGGRIGDDELTVHGMPQFHVGDDSVLFVHRPERKMMPLVALMHGVYPVLRETRTGEEYVLRSNGLPLYNAADVSLPMDRASLANAAGSSARPLTVKSFLSQLRARVPATTKSEN